MLSFGIEYERAFSIAFCSARLPAGSAPPSRAATMIARDSFEKSLPRLASAAPFLCLIDDHLLCPDMVRLPYRAPGMLVDPRVVGQLGMERGDDERGPARASTGSRRARPAPRRRGPPRAIHGARMKTPRSGSLAVRARGRPRSSRPGGRRRSARRGCRRGRGGRGRARSSPRTCRGSAPRTRAAPRRARRAASAA